MAKQVNMPPAERRSREPKAIARAPRTIVRRTLSEQTYEAIKERILDQTLEPGARLNIDSLSRELGVSSSPIRESLARLEAERLVVSELYTGYAVAPKPSGRYLADLVDLRIVIEGHCALVGAPKKDTDILLQMRQAWERMSSVASIGTRYREYRRFVEADAWFHQLLVDSADNEAISETYESLHAIIIQSRLYRNRESGAARSIEVTNEHRLILDAFEAGDGRAAAAALREHLEGGRRRLINQELAQADAEKVGSGRSRNLQRAIARSS
jgi:DNA-binding GntR family transcriptional regulator